MFSTNVCVIEKKGQTYLSFPLFGFVLTKVQSRLWRLHHSQGSPGVRMEHCILSSLSAGDSMNSDRSRVFPNRSYFSFVAYITRSFRRHCSTSRRPFDPKLLFPHQWQVWFQMLRALSAHGGSGGFAAVEMYSSESPPANCMSKIGAKTSVALMTQRRFNRRYGDNWQESHPRLHVHDVDVAAGKMQYVQSAYTQFPD
jgi:hypothetical protein